MNPQRLVVPALVVLTVASFTVASLSFVLYQRTNAELIAIKTNPSQAQKVAQDLVQQETAKLIGQVGKIADLPPGETPTVFTVTDKEKLKDKPFLALAENGDKILLYSQAKRAFLYRPSSNKVVDVVPVVIGGNGEVASSAAEKRPLEIALLNGTKTKGVATDMEGELRQKIQAPFVITKKDAIYTYSQTVVVDLTGSKKTQAEDIAKQIGGTVGDLPAGEKPPANADIVILIGAP